jgi:hypothetical protein
MDSIRQRLASLETRLESVSGQRARDQVSLTGRLDAQDKALARVEAGIRDILALLRAEGDAGPS